MRMLARSRHFRCRHSVLHRGGLSEHGSDSTCEQDPIENEMPGAHEPYPRGAHQASSLQEFWRQPRVRLLCHREQVQDVHCSDAWPPPKYACPEEGQAGRRIQTTGFLTVMLVSYQRHVAAVCIRDHSTHRGYTDADWEAVKISRPTSGPRLRQGSQAVTGLSHDLSLTLSGKSRGRSWWWNVSGREAGPRRRSIACQIARGPMARWLAAPRASPRGTTS